MRTMDDSTTNAIEVRNLVKGYKGVPVLHDVSFTVSGARSSLCSEPTARARRPRSTS